MTFENFKSLFLNGIDGYWSKNAQDIKVVSPLFHFLGGYSPMKKWCLINERSLDPSKCATFYLLAHDHNLYNHIGMTSNETNAECENAYYFDFNDSQISFLPQKILTCFRFIILGTGFGLQYLRVNCNRFKLLFYCFLFTIVLHLPSLY